METISKKNFGLIYSLNGDLLMQSLTRSHNQSSIKTFLHNFALNKEVNNNESKKETSSFNVSGSICIA